MPGTSGVYTRIPRQRATCIQPAGGKGAPEGLRGFGELCGVPRGLCGRRARKTPELQMFTSAGGRRGKRGSTDGGTNEREKGEKVHMRGRREGRRTVTGEEHLRVCAGSAQLAVTNGGHGTTEKVSVARFARVHLTKKSNIYFPAGTTKHFWNFFLRLSLRATRKREREKPDGVDEANVKKFSHARRRESSV